MLERVLQGAHRVADLTAVFVALGYRAADAPFNDRARVCARWRGFLVVGASADAPKDAVRALARDLAGRGERGLAASVGHGVLAVASPRIGAAGTTKALLVECARPSAFVLEQLRALGPARARSALAHALRVVEVLSAEAVGESFFRAFQRTWERMAASLPEPVSEPDRHLVALHALTRVLFLYFVQAKGWLDGNPAYMRTLLDATLGRGGAFHRRALDPLFFRTLNQPAAERTGRGLGRIPYLNGGLFAPHPVERRLGHVHFPDDEWITAFEGLFDRYRFCVQEAEELDAVAPDMLGRVFERLMEPGNRARSGTFYTPESVVREVVSATLSTAFAKVGGLPRRTVDRLMARGRLGTQERARTSAAARRLTVLDPAVGSGVRLGSKRSRRVGDNSVGIAVPDPAKRAVIRLFAPVSRRRGGGCHHPVRVVAPGPQLQSKAQHPGGWRPGIVCLWHIQRRQRFYGLSISGNSASRTAAMDAAGSRTQLSSLVAAATVALVMVFFTGQLAYLPKAALAGVVANAVLNLIEVEELRELWHMRRSEFWIAFACLLSVPGIRALAGCHHRLSDGYDRSAPAGLPARNLGAAGSS